MQIGKYTNFIDKSYCHAFQDYEENFKSKYSPSPKKHKPAIDTVNLISLKDKVLLPFGFVKMEL